MHPRKILVHRNDGIFECIILKHKTEGYWSWCNLTKGHICTCKFNSYEEALNDIYTEIEKGKVKKFEYANAKSNERREE